MSGTTNGFRLDIPEPHQAESFWPPVTTYSELLQGVIRAQYGIVILHFEGVLWEYQGEAPWVFVTMPVEEAGMIREMVPHKSGFGSIRVEATLGDTTWKTSVFPDRDSGAYVLPVKREVRQAEGVEPGDSVEVEIVVGDGR